MANVVVHKGGDGKLAGFGEAGARAWARFQQMLSRLQVGETLEFQWREPRSPGFHRRHFALLNCIYEQQDQFTDAEAFRMWCHVGAGFCSLVPGPKGKPVAIPDSIAWSKLDETEFQEHHLAVVRFLRSTHATRFLWPTLSDLQADEMINNLLLEFGA
ncbi:MAG TPA: DUF1367 family protein [Rubrivivax sp.]|nr:DUF1367 family protein [Rubrivivax sp.]HRY86531.1 DUF1367 family protein [Rubrivivax sp.]